MVVRGKVQTSKLQSAGVVVNYDKSCLCFKLLKYTS